MDTQVETIHNAIQFIEQHLKEDITVEDVASSAGYSLYHLIRTFNKITQHTPYDYLIRRRLSESAKDLILTKRLIVEIAFDYQFNNHETYSRSFKRMYAIQPSQWRSRGIVPYRSLLPALSLAYLDHVFQGGISKPTILERKKTSLLGLMNLGQNLSKAMVKTFIELQTELKRPGKKANYFIINTIFREKPLFYFIGVEANPEEEIKLPLVKMDLPKGTYGQFSHYGPKNSLPFSLDYIYHTWLSKTRNKPRFSMEIEILPEKYLRSDNNIRNSFIQLPIKPVDV